MIKIKRNCKEIEGSLSERNRRENKAKTEQKQGKNRGLRDFAASAKSALCCKTSSQPNCPLCENFCSCETNFGTRVPFRSTWAPISQLRNDCEAPKRERSYFRRESSISQRISQLRSHFLAHECHFAAQWPSFHSCEMAAKSQSVKTPNFAAKAPFRRVFCGCETTFWHMSAIWKPRTLISQLRNGCETSTP